MKTILHTLCVCLICISHMYGAFNEDDMIFEAIELEIQKQFDKARDAYLILYEETHKLEYLKEAVKLSASLENPQITLDFANDYLAQGGGKDIVMLRILLDSHLKLGIYDEALNEIQELMKLEDNPQLQTILGLLYLDKKDFARAKKAFDANYERTHSQLSLQKLIEIDLAQGKDKDAFKKLDAHIEQYGCSDSFCNFSLELYARSKQTSKIEAIIKRAFDENPTIQNAQHLIRIYTYQQKFKEALQIASQFPFNYQMMLELYVSQKDYLNASKQAKLVYEETKNPYFLGLEQIYTFESLQDKTDMKKLKAIASTLQKAIEMMQASNPNITETELNQVTLNIRETLSYFLNFLGYMLIDHELDVQKGITYAQEALKLTPIEPAYLDSLAWGYYKLQQCTLAQETFKQIPESEIKKEQEMQDHQRLIQKCKK